MVMKSSAFAHSIITLRCFEASKHHATCAHHDPRSWMLSASSSAKHISQEPGHDIMTPLEGLLGSGRVTFVQDCVMTLHTLRGRWPRHELNAHIGGCPAGNVIIIPKQRHDACWAGRVAADHCRDAFSEVYIRKLHKHPLEPCAARQECQHQWCHLWGQRCVAWRFVAVYINSYSDALEARATHWRKLHAR